MEDRICTIDGCGRNVKARGMCNMHYHRMKKYGIPDMPDQRLSDRHCAIEGCDKRHRCRDYCETHYRRLTRNGDPHMVRIGIQLGEDNPSWVGNAIKYRGLHKRLQIHHGPAANHECVDCDGRAEQWSYDHTDPDERRDKNGCAYSTDVRRYHPRCRSCHKAFDNKRRSA